MKMKVDAGNIALVIGGLGLMYAVRKYADKKFGTMSTDQNNQAQASFAPATTTTATTDTTTTTTANQSVDRFKYLWDTVLPGGMKLKPIDLTPYIFKSDSGYEYFVVRDTSGVMKQVKASDLKAEHVPYLGVPAKSIINWKPLPVPVVNQPVVVSRSQRPVVTQSYKPIPVDVGEPNPVLNEFTPKPVPVRSQRPVATQPYKPVEVSKPNPAVTEFVPPTPVVKKSPTTTYKPKPVYNTKPRINTRATNIAGLLR